MKRLVILLFGIFHLVGCKSDKPTVEAKPEVVIEGQVFVVTKGRENIKMGLTPIHIVSDEDFQKIALELAKEIKAFRVEGIQRAANSEAKTELIRELLAMEERGWAKPTLAALREEVAASMAEYIVKNRFLVHEDMERSKLLLFSMMPDATTKTDADGRFKISVNSKSWVIAQGQRSLGKESEDYLWIASIKEPEKSSKSPLLISNDSAYDSTEELFALLDSVSASGSDVLPAVGSGEVDQETDQLIRDANEKAKQAIRMAEQAAEDEKRMAEQEAEAAKQAAEAERLQRIKELASVRKKLSDASLAGQNVVVAWGSNTEKQCNVPSGLTDVVGIAAGSGHSLALKKDGTVVAWGYNGRRECDVPSYLTNVAGVVAGFGHSLALKKVGSAVAWGGNSSNQCKVPSGLTDVVGVAAGEGHSLALKKDGSVVAWGYNADNQCDVPSGLTDVVEIAAGSRHNLALKMDGSVVAWGDNTDKQCDVPSDLTDVVGIAAGWGHSLALKMDGSVVAWGSNTEKQCDVPSGLTDVMGIAAGVEHSLAFKKDGVVVAWGDNTDKQCDVPSGLTDVVGIAAGMKHSLALKKANKN